MAKLSACVYWLHLCWVHWWHHGSMHERQLRSADNSEWRAHALFFSNETFRPYPLWLRSCRYCRHCVCRLLMKPACVAPRMPFTSVSVFWKVRPANLSLHVSGALQLKCYSPHNTTPESPPSSRRLLAGKSDPQHCTWRWPSTSPRTSHEIGVPEKRTQVLGKLLVKEDYVFLR